MVNLGKIIIEMELLIVFDDHVSRRIRNRVSNQIWTPVWWRVGEQGWRQVRGAESRNRYYKW